MRQGLSWPIHLHSSSSSSQHGRMGLAGGPVTRQAAVPAGFAADRSWKEFREGPDWIKARKEPEKDAVLVEKVESVYLNPTDYPPIK